MNESLLGCYVSFTATNRMSVEEQNSIFEKGRLFKSYIWGENGIARTLNQLPPASYGNDLKLILFEFYVHPASSVTRHLKAINYKKQEKTICLPIIINDENFFNKADTERCYFLKGALISKLETLIPFCTQKRLNCEVGKIKLDLLSSW